MKPGDETAPEAGCFVNAAKKSGSLKSKRRHLRGATAVPAAPGLDYSDLVLRVTALVASLEPFLFSEMRPNSIAAARPTLPANGGKRHGTGRATAVSTVRDTQFASCPFISHWSTPRRDAVGG